MGFGRYRFRRSFGQVGSQFRGARPDTYPLLSYVKDGLALAYEALSSLIISDKSGNGNDATLYTGRYFSTDGSTDRGIVADCSAAGSGSYYLTGKIKPSGTTQAKATINGSALNLSGLTADVWQDFTTTTKTSVTPDTVTVGWNGGGNHSAADWSDVRLIDASDDSVVGRWQGNDSSAANLDGYPALDSSGNGYHGTHVGCAGGTGEGIDPDFVGAVFEANEDKMWFDGVDVDIATPGLLPATGDFTLIIEFIPKTVSLGIYGSLSAVDSGRHVIQVDALGNIFAFVAGIGSLTTANSIDLGKNNTITFTRSGSDWSLTLNDGDTVTRTGSRTLDVAGSNIGDPYSGSNFNGIISSLSVGSTTWDGTEGDALANGWTVNGDPVTVGQKRETILQTAGQDFNRGYVYDGSTNSSSITGISETDFDISVQVLINSFSTEQPIFCNSFNANNAISFTASNAVRFRVATNQTISINNSVPTNELVTLRFVRSGSTFTVYVNNVEEGSGTVETGTFAPNNFGFRGGVNVYLGGIAYSPITVNGTEYSTKPTSGNYTTILIPESTTAGEDALGNAIDNPRVNNEVINLFGNGEYALVPDDDSLDLTTEATWEFWGNFYGVPASDEAIISKYDTGGNQRSWFFVKDPSAAADEVGFRISDDGATPAPCTINGLTDKVSQIVLTKNGATYTAYIDGVPTTITGTPDPGPVFNSTAPVLIGSVLLSSVLSWYSTYQGGDIRIYDRALTADEVLQNYNARKSAYGL